MELTQAKFFVFFLAVYLLLWLVRWIFEKRRSYKTVYDSLLLVASYGFIGLVDYRFCIVMAVFTACIYGLGLLIPTWKKKALIAGLIVSIFPLFVTKYFNFFAESFGKVFGISVSVWQILVPVGISFYTFSAIAYLMDVYREKYAANRNVAEVALYLSFFPKLTAGPIVKPDGFFSQLRQEHYVSLSRLSAGIQQVAVGLFEKMVIADHLAVFVNDVYTSPSSFTGATVLWAVITYSLQLYFDFAGYSDVAIGIAKMIGFDFSKNFDLPYASQNPTEFWKRWHISLSSWLQEYLYYPLGGNRKGKTRTYINLLLTMLIGGLWHGADLTFVLWGGIHGVGLIVHKIYRKKFARPSPPPPRGLFMVGMFAFSTFAWIFFRADSVEDAFAVIGQIFSSGGGISQLYAWTFLAIAVSAFEIVFAYFRNHRQWNGLERQMITWDLTSVWGIALFLSFLGILVMMAYIGDTAFIYGQF